MKLTVLGANGPYPSADGACSGYLLESDSGSTRIVLDFGTRCLSALSALMPAHEITAVVLTHLHYDHMSDMLPLQYALQFSPRETPIPVYCPEEPRRVHTLLDSKCFDLSLPEDGMIGEIRFSFLSARHPVPAVCVCAEANGTKFIYTGDTNVVDGLELFADGADALLADAGLSEADWKPGAPHLSAKKCGELARDARAGQLYITHLNPKYNPEALLAEAREAFPGTEIAVRGDIIYL